MWYQRHTQYVDIRGLFYALNKHTHEMKKYNSISENENDKISAERINNKPLSVSFEAQQQIHSHFRLRCPRTHCINI